MRIKELQAVCHENAVQAGWWTDLETGESLITNREKAGRICLMHSELSEAMEGARKDSMDDKLPYRKMEEVELADTIIRILDYAGAYEYDIEGAIIEKMNFNKNRPDHFIENRKKKNGKKF
tara:strand:+ start:176 stop:538 length:363 start_codon:yes stop_codon:yes gene_type:complete